MQHWPSFVASAGQSLHFCVSVFGLSIRLHPLPRRRPRLTPIGRMAQIAITTPAQILPLKTFHRLRRVLLWVKWVTGLLVRSVVMKLAVQLDTLELGARALRWCPCPKPFQELLILVRLVLRFPVLRVLVILAIHNQDHHVFLMRQLPVVRFMTPRLLLI